MSKKSNFPALTTVPSDATFDFVSNGTNYKISIADLASYLGSSGSISQTGNALGAPVLEQQGAEKYIRNIENGAGIRASISAQNGVNVATNLVNGAGGVGIIENAAAPQIKLRSITAGSGIAVGQSNGSIVISTSDISGGGNVVVVNSVDDLPTPVSGVITLLDNTIYVISSSNVDISDNRIVLGTNTVLSGNSELTNKITSSTTGDFITGSDDCEIKSVALDCPLANVINFNSSNPGEGSLVIQNVVVDRCRKIADLTSYNIFLTFNFLIRVATQDGVSINGSCNFMTMSTFLIEDIQNGIALDLGASTHSIIQSENVTIIPTNAAVKPFEGAANSANINVGGSAAIRAVNVLGAFTPSSNVLSGDIRWEFYGSNVIPDSRNTSYITMPTNATETVVQDGTPVKLAGTFTDQISSRFTNDTTGRATYIGVKDIAATVSVSFSFTKAGSGVDSYIFYIAKNGSVITHASKSVSAGTTDAPSITTLSEVSLSTNDYLEVFVEGNGTTDNVTIQSFGMVINA